jgi:AraC-like DNA-binding protein
MRRQTEERRRQVEQWIAEQEASGLTVKEFAKQRGITQWTLHDGKRKRRLLTRKRARQDFVEVAVVGEARLADAITVEVGAGLRLHVAADFDESHLRRLLAVLRSC